jgi:hypothetical protein
MAENPVTWGPVERAINDAIQNFWNEGTERCVQRIADTLRERELVIGNAEWLADAAAGALVDLHLRPMWPKVAKEFYGDHVDAISKFLDEHPKR